MLKLMIVCTGLSGLLAQASAAETSKFNITDAERAACHDDATALCSDTFPDEDKLLACMKVNRPHLSQGCRVVFNEGMKRRHLN